MGGAGGGAVNVPSYLRVVSPPTDVVVDDDVDELVELDIVVETGVGQFGALQSSLHAGARSIPATLMAATALNSAREAKRSAPVGSGSLI